MVRKDVMMARLAMFLAATDATEADVREFVRVVRAVPPGELTNLVLAFRAISDMRFAGHETSSAEELYELSRAPTAPASDETSLSYARSHRLADEAFSRRAVTMSDDLAAQVERLLINESGMTKAHAADLLTSAILRKYPDRLVQPYSPKEGFARWLRAVSKTVPASELMHFASVIRSSRVHSPGDDWIEKS